MDPQRVSNMTVQEMVKAWANEAYIHDGRSHVTILYSDGELCMTKAGPLYGQRTFHQTRPPIFPDCGHYVEEFGLTDPTEISQFFKKILDDQKPTLSVHLDNDVQGCQIRLRMLEDQVQMEKDYIKIWSK